VQEIIPDGPRGCVKKAVPELWFNGHQLSWFA